jgi:hypothetical protein
MDDALVILSYLEFIIIQRLSIRRIRPNPALPFRHPLPNFHDPASAGLFALKRGIATYLAMNQRKRPTPLGA